MADLKWSGLNGGLVSDDGRFLVCPVWVEGKRGKVQRWAVFGLVIERAPTGDARTPPWSWGNERLADPFDRKKDAQSWCARSSYRTLIRKPDERKNSSSGAYGHDTPPAFNRCRECLVPFDRVPGWLYDDYCGKNCLDVVEERVAEINQNLRQKLSG
jgi:hypothetical protein